MAKKLCDPASGKPFASGEPRLLDRVIASLDADKAWDDLAAKRDAEIERGDSTPVNGPEAVARLRLDLA